MIQRLMTLLVVSAVLFSEVKPHETLQGVAQNVFDGARKAFISVLNDSRKVIANAVDDVVLLVNDVADDSRKVVANAASDVKVLVNDAAQKVGSQITLHVNNQGSNLAVLSLGDGSDVAGLALDGIKVLTQAIKPEQAAFNYIKLQKQTMDSVLVTLPSKINLGLAYAESVQDGVAMMGPMLQSIMDAMKQKELDLVVMKAALPQDILGECDAAIMGCMQAYIAKFHRDIASVDFTMCVQVEPLEQELAKMVFNKEAFADFFVQWMADYSNGIVEALLAVLEQYYVIDRAALGLAA